MDLGLIAGIVGGVIGVLGAAIGTRASIKNTTGPEQRSLMIKASLTCWIGAVAFVVLRFVLPAPYVHLLWISWAILLVWGIRATNRRLKEIEGLGSDA